MTEPKCLPTIFKVYGLWGRMLADDEAGWHIGTFGALAEFHHVDGESKPSVRVTDDGLAVVTARGGIGLQMTPGVLPVAWEWLSKRPDAWTQGIAFCLPTGEAAMGRRPTLTELGPDTSALRKTDREAILFDMGLDATHVDFCIRTADWELIAALRSELGRSILEPGSLAMSAIKAASPHRVCISRLGRIEVFQPIPAATPGAHAPVGPHTHVLPDLLRLKRTHSANTPIPHGWLPALNLHPKNPVSDRMGGAKPFDSDAYTRFQSLLRTYAPPGFVAEKNKITQAVKAGVSPREHGVASSRIERTAARVALRQLLHNREVIPGLEHWLTVFDRRAEIIHACA